MQSEPQVSFFLGANAPTGFYSLYDQLIDPAQARDIYILKGGPGCGKSSLMRKVGKAMEERGLQVEYIVCSGDPDSLDAILIPERKTALVDGTAQIEEDMRALLSTQVLEAKMAKRARGILSREVKKTALEDGRSVQRFLGGVTWKGVLCSYSTADTLCKRIYELSDTYGLAHGMLHHLAAGALSAGHDIIVCPSPMAPDRMEHLLIPSLSLAFLSSSPARPYPRRPYRRIRLDAMLDPELLRRNKARLKFSRKVAAALTDEAVEALGQAKAMHDELEGLYNPHVDFEGVYRTAVDIVEEMDRHA